MEISYEEWNSSYSQYKEMKQYTNDFGMAQEENIEINYLISIIAYHGSPDISLDYWIKCPKSNIFFFNDKYYYGRYFADAYWINRFTNYKDLYDYIYTHDFIFVLHRDFCEITKEKYIEIVRNSNLDFSIDKYWLLSSLIYVFNPKNIGDLLDCIISKIDQEHFKYYCDKKTIVIFNDFIRCEKIKSLKYKILFNVA